MATHKKCLSSSLAAAKTLHERPELGITHVLSVCPDYPEGEEARRGANAAGKSARPTVHRCLAIEDSEYEDILSLLPSAIAFIKGALEPQNSSGKFTGQKTKVQSRRGKREADLGLEEASGSVPRQKHKVLVHCVMGISRSTTVVCAYRKLFILLACLIPADKDQSHGYSTFVFSVCSYAYTKTWGIWSSLFLGHALRSTDTGRPQVHPNYGFRRQLQIFGECGYFTDYSGPIRTHPVYTTWQRKKKREVAKYLGRLENIVEIKLDDEKELGVSFTECVLDLRPIFRTTTSDPSNPIASDFPTDQLEAASLLSEIGATHLLTVTPASLPSSHTHPPSGALRVRRPSGLVSPFLSPAASSMMPSDSTAPSPMSSRSSSFSNSSRTSSSLSNASTAATSVLSLPSLLPPSKLRLEVSSSDSDEESENELEYSIEPDYLALAGVEHHHIAVKDTDTIGLLLRLGEASLFIQHALDEEGSESDQDLSPPNRNNNNGPKHVLIHCSTEARACTVVCAYLMSCKGLKPSQAYSLIENGVLFS